MILSLKKVSETHSKFDESRVGEWMESTPSMNHTFSWLFDEICKFYHTSEIIMFEISNNLKKKIYHQSENSDLKISQILSKIFRKNTKFCPKIAK